MLTPLFISELLVSVVEMTCHDIAIVRGDHACSTRGCMVQCTLFTSGYACPVYSIHVAITETMAFTIIISGSAIFSAGLRPFYM